jgi:hypothetical protein
VLLIYLKLLVESCPTASRRLLSLPELPLLATLLRASSLLFDQFSYAQPRSPPADRRHQIRPTISTSTLVILHNFQNRFYLPVKMHSHEYPVFVVIYCVCAWSLGVEIPRKPWLTWWIVLVIESGLLWYSHQLTQFLWSDIQGTQSTIRRRCLAGIILLSSLLLLVGYTCCKDGRWIGVVTADQEDMIAATLFAEMLLGFFYFGCTCVL